jgi:hypothetical protein
MTSHFASEPDLMPPPFAEGLDDWSCGDGTPDSPSYDRASFARIAVNDPDFGTCLEMRKVEPLQRLRYMGELPLPRDGCLEISVRLKALRGPLAAVRIAAWPGGAQGREVRGLPATAPERRFAGHCAVLALSAVIGRRALPGVDLVWDARALYAHVGIELLGSSQGVVRVESLAVRDVTARFVGERLMPGFSEPPAAVLTRADQGASGQPLPGKA